MNHLCTRIDLMWTPVSQCDPRLVSLFRSHYSCKNPTTRRVNAGGGRTSCLLHGPTGEDAAWVWSFQRYGHLAGVAYNMFFRRVKGARASDLIVAAETFIPPDLLPIVGVSFVDCTKVRSSNPGFCFREAGWEVVGRAKNPNLLRLEKRLT